MDDSVDPRAGDPGVRGSDVPGDDPPSGDAAAAADDALGADAETGTDGAVAAAMDTDVVAEADPEAARSANTGTATTAPDERVASVPDPPRQGTGRAALALLIALVAVGLGVGTLLGATAGDRSAWFLGGGPQGGGEPGASAATPGRGPSVPPGVALPVTLPSAAVSGQPTGLPAVRSVGPSFVPSAEPVPLTSDQYVAPRLRAPLRNLDPGIGTRGPRPTLARLATFQFGLPMQLYKRNAQPSDWQLRDPNMTAVRGYAGVVSVLPGGSVPLHLSGSDPFARLDVFRMGARDATHLLTVPHVVLHDLPGARPQSPDGRVEEHWPVTTTLRVQPSWSSGFYLVKLTGPSGHDSYVPFVVRAAHATPLVVVLPAMTWQAYNGFGGSNLYSWPTGPRPRAYAVSFDRPYADGWGASLFFRLDFPLVVWLEDHGYSPSYVTDLDLAIQPNLLDGVRTVIFSGHGEYWTRGLRDAADAASARGTNLAFFGANQAFWQSRVEPATDGTANRTVLSYKSRWLDPVVDLDPISTTTRFQEQPVNRPPSDLMGLAYGGVLTGGLRPMVVGPGLATFAPDLGLRAGQQLPGLIGGEIDSAPAGFQGLALTATPVTVNRTPPQSVAAAAVWVKPGGGRVFDAGTFDWSWGLDPRYAAGLPGFPASQFEQLTARILAWLGAQPG